MLYPIELQALKDVIRVSGRARRHVSVPARGPFIIALRALSASGKECGIEGRSTLFPAVNARLLK